MNHLGRHIKIHYGNFRKSFAVFWLVILAVFALDIGTGGGNIGITYTSSLNGGIYHISSFVAAVLPAAVVYHLVKCFSTYGESYSFAIGLGSTRTGYFTGLICFCLLLTAVMSLLLSGIFSLEAVLYRELDFSHGHFNLLEAFFPVSSSWLKAWAFFFSILAAATAVFNLAAALFYRVGKVFWLVLLVIFLLLFLQPVEERGLDFIRFFSAEESFLWFNLKLLGLAALLFLGCLPLFHRLEVKTPAVQS